MHEEMPLLEQHRSAIHLAHEHLPTTRPAGLANCMSRAVVARALYCVGDEGILARFCDVLRRGASTGSLEHIVVTLRNHLIELRKYGMNQTVRQRQYALVTRALHAYLQCEPLKILRPANMEVFYLPDEIRSDAVA